MSFVLRGNTRELRFTGATRALAEPAEEAAPVSTGLGKPRVRRAPASLASSSSLPPPSAPPPSAPASVAPPSRRTLDTPTRVGGPAVRIPPGFLAPQAYAPVLRHAPPTIDPDPSIDDDCKTTAMVRDALDVLPGANALLSPKPPRAVAPSPIPHFRSREHQANAKTVIVPRRATKRRGARLPLAVWLVAAAVAGVVSFHVAPDVVARFEPALVQR